MYILVNHIRINNLKKTSKPFLYPKMNITSSLFLLVLIEVKFMLTNEEVFSSVNVVDD